MRAEAAFSEADAQAIAGRVIAALREGAAPAARILNASQVGELLGVPASWVYAEARAGRIPHIRLGRYVRFREDVVDRWLQDRERGPGGR